MVTHPPRAEGSDTQAMLALYRARAAHYDKELTPFEPLRVAAIDVSADKLELARDYLPPDAWSLISDQIEALLAVPPSGLGLTTFISLFLALWTARASVAAGQWAKVTGMPCASSTARTGAKERRWIGVAPRRLKPSRSIAATEPETVSATTRLGSTLNPADPISPT